MKAWLPDMPPLGTCSIERTAASRFESAHQIPKVHRPEFDQPMQMIWHQYPSQRSAAALMVA